VAPSFPCFTRTSTLPCCFLERCFLTCSSALPSRSQVRSRQPSLSLLCSHWRNALPLFPHFPLDSGNQNGPLFEKKRACSVTHASERTIHPPLLFSVASPSPGCRGTPHPFPRRQVVFSHAGPGSTPSSCPPTRELSPLIVLMKVIVSGHSVFAQ